MNQQTIMTHMRRRSSGERKVSRSVADGPVAEAGTASGVSGIRVPLWCAMRLSTAVLSACLPCTRSTRWDRLVAAWRLRRSCGAHAGWGSLWRPGRSFLEGRRAGGGGVWPCINSGLGLLLHNNAPGRCCTAPATRVHTQQPRVSEPGGAGGVQSRTPGCAWDGLKRGGGVPWQGASEATRGRTA